MMRNILLVIIIVLLLWNAVILCDIRQALYGADLETKNGEFHKEKNEQPKKPGKLIPNPALPQWEL